jgi:hypothetical protein
MLEMLTLNTVLNGLLIGFGLLLGFIVLDHLYEAVAGWWNVRTFHKRYRAGKIKGVRVIQGRPS